MEITSLLQPETPYKQYFEYQFSISFTKFFTSFYINFSYET